MGANKNATIVPGHGTLFVADRGTELPADPLAAFTLTGEPPTGWTNVGHTSKGNQPAFSKEGGEKTVLDSWLADGVDVVYSSTQWGLAVASLQVDEDNLDLAFDGFFDPTNGSYVVPASNPGLEKSMFLLATDGTGSLGFYMENTNTSIGDAPSIDASAFFELPLAASILSADPDFIPAKADGTPGIMAIFKTGLVAALPKVQVVTNPAGTTIATAAAGALIELTGSGYSGVTGAGGVKFGAINAGADKYIVISDTKISVIVPAGSGSQPITVTNPTGTSTPPKAFTIS